MYLVFAGLRRVRQASSPRCHFNCAGQGRQAGARHMGWLRALVSGGSPAATGAASPAGTPQPLQQPQAEQQWQSPASSDGGGTPDMPDKGLRGLDSPGDFAAAKGVGGTSFSGGAEANPASGEPHVQYDLGTPQPGEGGEEVVEEWEEGEEAYYYGADALRQRGWRHTENQVLLWVVAALVAAIAINVGVSGEQRPGTAWGVEGGG